MLRAIDRGGDSNDIRWSAVTYTVNGTPLYESQAAKRVADHRERFENMYWFDVGVKNRNWPSAKQKLEKLLLNGLGSEWSRRRHKL
jgi:hypothetical protein